LLAFIVMVLAGCAQTEYYTYSGSPVMIGTGGASKNVNGIDLWITGTPPRKFQVIGYITDSRFGGPIAMAGRNAGMAAEAKRAGGDGLIMSSDWMNQLGTYSTGNAYAWSTGNSVNVTGNAVAMPIIRREGRYYVIRYIQ
jgi:hypothetical protein